MWRDDASLAMRPLLEEADVLDYVSRSQLVVGGSYELVESNLAALAQSAAWRDVRAGSEAVAHAWWSSQVIATLTVRGAGPATAVLCLHGGSVFTCNDLGSIVASDIHDALARLSTAANMTEYATEWTPLWGYRNKIVES